MQLINSTIYDKQAQSRNKAIEETRQQKVARRNQREKQKIQRHLQSIVRPSGYAMASPSVHEITIHGLRFHVLDGGSKLARIRGNVSAFSISLLKAYKLETRSIQEAQPPSKLISVALPLCVAGTGTSIDQEWSRPRSTSSVLYWNNTRRFERTWFADSSRGNVQHKKINEPCKRFTSTGIPSFAPSYMSMRIVLMSKYPSNGFPCTDT